VHRTESLHQCVGSVHNIIFVCSAYYNIIFTASVTIYQTHSPRRVGYAAREKKFVLSYYIKIPVSVCVCVCLCNAACIYLGAILLYMYAVCARLKTMERVDEVQTRRSGIYDPYKSKTKSLYSMYTCVCVCVCGL